MTVEVRAKGLRQMRQQHGLTQLEASPATSASSQNDVPAIEADDRQAGQKLQQQLMQYLGCSFDALLKVVLIDPETQTERVLQPKSSA